MDIDTRAYFTAVAVIITEVAFTPAPSRLADE